MLELVCYTLFVAHLEYQNDQLQGYFDHLKDRWLEGTAFLSNSGAIFAHPAYREIIRMGEPVIPLILQDLRKELNHWFGALVELAGLDAAEGEDTMEGARQKWLNWGESKGYTNTEPPK